VAAEPKEGDRSVCNPVVDYEHRIRSSCHFSGICSVELAAC